MALFRCGGVLRPCRQYKKLHVLSLGVGQLQVTSIKLMTFGPQDLVNLHTLFTMTHILAISGRELAYQDVQQIGCWPQLQRIDFRETGLANWIRSCMFVSGNRSKNRTK